METRWNDERVAILKQMWKDGETSSAIGKKLEITPNAVIGKAHRLKLFKRPKNFQAAQAAARQAMSAAHTTKPRKASSTKTLSVQRRRSPEDPALQGSTKGPSKKAIALIESVQIPSITFDFSIESLCPHLVHPERYEAIIKRK